MRVRELLDKVAFNYQHRELLPDGSVLVTLIKHGDPHVYKMRVRDLYLPTEVVLEELVERGTHGD